MKWLTDCWRDTDSRKEIERVSEMVIELFTDINLYGARRFSIAVAAAAAAGLGVAIAVPIGCTYDFNVIFISFGAEISRRQRQ